MSRICDICFKGSQKGNLVPRGIGHRVTKRTITTRGPNLRTKKFVVNGRSFKLVICSSCLKRLKFEDKLIHANAQVATA